MLLNNHAAQKSVWWNATVTAQYFFQNKYTSTNVYNIGMHVYSLMMCFACLCAGNLIWWWTRHGFPAVDQVWSFVVCSGTGVRHHSPTYWVQILRKKIGFHYALKQLHGNIPGTWWNKLPLLSLGITLVIFHNLSKDQISASHLSRYWPTRACIHTAGSLNHESQNALGLSCWAELLSQAYQACSVVNHNEKSFLRQTRICLSTGEVMWAVDGWRVTKLQDAAWRPLPPDKTCI